MGYVSRKRFNSVRITLALLSITLSWVEVSGDHSGLCFRPPVVTGGDDEWKGRYNFTGLGIKKLQELLPEASKEFWKYWRDKFEDEVIDEAETRAKELIIEAYVMTSSRPPKNKGSHIMDNWFKVVVRDVDAHLDFNHEVKGFVLWAENEAYETVGEWVTNTEFGKVQKYESCQENDLTEYMSISCGGASPYQPVVSNTVVYLNNSNNIPEMARGDKNAFHFYLRLYGHPCAYTGMSDPFIKIRLRAAIKGKDELLYRHFFIETRQTAVIGSPDLIPTDDHLSVSCQKVIFFLTSYDPLNYPYWIRAVPRSSLLQTNVHDNRYYGCQSYLYGGRCKYAAGISNASDNFPAGDKIPIKDKQNIASTETTPRCSQASKENWKILHRRDTMETATPDPELKNYLFTKYDDYLETYKTPPPGGRACDPSMAPPDPANCVITRVDENGNPIKIEEEGGASGQGYTAIALDAKDHNKEEAYEVEWPTESDEGVIFDDHRGLYITRPFVMLWYLRKAHGIAMVIATMFVIPLSIFLARYYKESYMSYRIHHFHYWYEFHTHATGWILAFMIAGFIIAFICRDCLGKSLTGMATAHRIFALISFISLIVVLAGGSLRSMTTTPRYACITCHWFWGTLLYISNIAAVYTSLYIPGSAIANIDASIPPGENTHSDVPFNINLVVVSLWVVLDISLHILMSVLLCRSDKQMEIVAPPRKYLPVPIPVIRESEEVDAPGGSCRETVLSIYFVASLVCTVVMILVIHTSPTIGKGFGPLACTHYDDSWKSVLPDVLIECTIK